MCKETLAIVWIRTGDLRLGVPAGVRGGAEGGHDRDAGRRGARLVVGDRQRPGGDQRPGAAHQHRAGARRQVGGMGLAVDSVVVDVVDKYWKRLVDCTGRCTVDKLVVISLDRSGRCSR